MMERIGGGGGRACENSGFILRYGDSGFMDVGAEPRAGRRQAQGGGGSLAASLTPGNGDLPSPTPSSTHQGHQGLERGFKSPRAHRNARTKNQKVPPPRSPLCPTPRTPRARCPACQAAAPPCASNSLGPADTSPLTSQRAFPRPRSPRAGCLLSPRSLLRPQH